jgi:hypothetical protein
MRTRLIDKSARLVASILIIAFEGVILGAVSLTAGRLSSSFSMEGMSGTSSNASRKKVDPLELGEERFEQRFVFQGFQ